MNYKVIKPHRSEFPNPITFSKGDTLSVGEKYEGDEDWEDWYYCETTSQIAGWVPKQIIRWISDGEGEALEDYTAKEMDVDEGDVLTGARVLNGWVWCQNHASKEEGWVPMENLVRA